MQQYLPLFCTVCVISCHYSLSAKDKLRFRHITFSYHKVCTVLLCVTRPRRGEAGGATAPPPRPGWTGASFRLHPAGNTHTCCPLSLTPAERKNYEPVKPTSSIFFTQNSRFLRKQRTIANSRNPRKNGGSPPPGPHARARSRCHFVRAPSFIVRARPTPPTRSTPRLALFSHLTKTGRIKY